MAERVWLNLTGRFSVFTRFSIVGSIRDTRNLSSRARRNRHLLHTPKVTGTLKEASSQPMNLAFSQRRTLESSRTARLGAARPVAAKRRVRAATLGIMLTMGKCLRSTCSGIESILMNSWSLLGDLLCEGKRQFIYAFSHLDISHCFHLHPLGSHQSPCEKTMTSF